MISNKQREEDELIYSATNDTPESVCSGVFYISNQKKREACKHCLQCSKHKVYQLMKDHSVNVKFRHVASFRKCKLYEKYRIDEVSIMQNVTYNVLYFNELVQNFCIDLKTYKKDMDKESLKMVGAIQKRMKAYDRRIKEILGRTVEVFSDICDSMDEIFMPKVKKLMAMLQLLYRSGGIKQYKLVGYLETVRFLLCFSEEIRSKNIEFASVFNKEVLSLRSYNMDEVVPIFDNLIKWVIRKEEFGVINANKDKGIMDEFRSLKLSALDLSNIQKCISKNER